MTPNETKGVAATRYEQLKTNRDPFLRRARACAALTIPSLIPPENHTGHQDLTMPSQSVGAGGVNTLSSKVMLVMFPPNSPFFRLVVDKPTLQELGAVRGDAEKALSDMEQTVHSYYETKTYRANLGESIKHLIVGGNVLLHLPMSGGVKVIPLSNYVVKRDPQGNVLEIVVKEIIAPNVIPDPDIRTAVQASLTSEDKTVDLFTHIMREDNRWTVYQEVRGMKLPTSFGTYPLEKPAFIPLRWNSVDGEDYGRGRVEEFYGDLHTLNELSHRLTEGAAIASRFVTLVNPAGLTEANDVEEAPNGAVIDGREEDVSTLQSEKYADFQWIKAHVDDLKRDLARAFLMTASIQRNGERVTAEEIRVMAGELEDGVGGVYSILSVEFQLPFVRRLIHIMETERKLPKLPEGVAEPAIVSGIEALGRGHDLNKLQQLAAGIAQTFGEEGIRMYLDGSEFAARLGAALGIETDGLVRNREEVEQAQQAQMMQQMAEKLGPNAINQVGQMAQKGMENGGS